MQSGPNSQIGAITENLYIARQLLIFGLHLRRYQPQASSTSEAECAPGISRGASLRAFTMKNAALALQCARDVQPDTDLAKSIDDAIKMQTQDDDCIVAMVQVVENLLAQLGADPKKSMFFGDFNYGDDKIALGDEVVGHEIGRLQYDRLPFFLGGGFEHEPDFIPRESFCTPSWRSPSTRAPWVAATIRTSCSAQSDGTSGHWTGPSRHGLGSSTSAGRGTKAKSKGRQVLTT
ncbi:MAG: hypothetical protein IPJ49_20145 [Candidatus Obscuribacter sp.]|nr:hypothetical protein [Candidatus Obscuribacter sp.]